jgi:hypothetical protein
LLLPCNVTVSYVGDSVTEVSIVDPLSMLGFVNHPDLEAVAEEARARLDRVTAALQKLV